MLQQRTQIYLEPRQHAILIEEARRLGLSLAGVIRRIVDEHFARKEGSAQDFEGRKKAALSLIGLGASGLSDVSAKPDEYLAGAILGEVVSEAGPGYRGKGRKRRKK